MNFSSIFTALGILTAGLVSATGGEFVPLFAKDGKPEGFTVQLWSDIAKPPPEGAAWEVKEGVLMSTGTRGNWIISEKEYGDFILEYDFKLGPKGNSGCALRTPAAGDPAFDGLEMQMADFRYNEKALESELTGGLYRAAAPSKQVYKPEAWNSVRIELRGAKVKITMNDQVIQDISLEDFKDPVSRHDKSMAPPLKDRPRKGRIGFQNLGRDSEPVRIRNAKIQEIAAEKAIPAAKP
jgi:hypothetical protein